MGKVFSSSAILGFSQTFCFVLFSVTFLSFLFLVFLLCFVLLCFWVVGWIVVSWFDLLWCGFCFSLAACFEVVVFYGRGWVFSFRGFGGIGLIALSCLFLFFAFGHPIA